MTGSAGQRRVPKAFLQGLEIPLPPLDEQTRIAAMLDQVNCVRKMHLQAADKASELLAVLTNRAFTNQL